MAKAQQPGIRTHLNRMRVHRENTVELAQALENVASRLAGALTCSPARRDIAEALSGLEELGRLESKLKRCVTTHDEQRARLNSLQPNRSVTVLQRRESLADDRLFSRLARTLTLARSIKESVRELLHFDPVPLYAPDRTETSPEIQRELVIDRFSDLFNQVVNPNEQSASSNALGCYTDIPLPATIFMADSQAAFRVALAQRAGHPIRFMDVGCGGGTKLLLAAQIFETVHGLEFDPGYVRAARQMAATLDLDDVEIFQADARAFERYSDYDVLYFFQPMADPAGLRELEDHISRRAREGTILMAPYSQFHSRAAELGCGHIAGNLFLARRSQEEADVLRDTASRMGTTLTQQIPMTRKDFWFFEPIVMGLLANGFVPATLKPERAFRR